jgi:prolipoprotein diacylglyceryltransferase
MNYAESKGYHKEVGLIGLLGIIGLIVLIVLPDKIRDGPEARMSTRKIWGLVLMALGLGLFMVGYVLEEAVFGGDRYSNGGFGESLIVLGLILLIVSLVMLLYNRKRTQPKETHPEDAHEGET